MDNRLKLRSFLAAAAGVVLLLGTEVAAHVVSYAPITQQIAIPAVQARSARHCLLVELTRFGGGWFGGWAGMSGVLVVHDADGLEPPRTVLAESVVLDAAAREDVDGTMQLLAYSDAPMPGDVTPVGARLDFSGDGGLTWRRVELPPTIAFTPLVTFQQGAQIMLPDVGGRDVRGRHPAIRLGTKATPFVLAGYSRADWSRSAIIAVDADGKARTLVENTFPTPAGFGALTLVGSNRDRTVFYFVGAPELPSGAMNAQAQTVGGVYAVSVDGVISPVYQGLNGAAIEAWGSGDDTVYLDVTGSEFLGPIWDCSRCLIASLGSAGFQLFTHLPTDWTNATMIAVPAHDFAGAWVMQRAPAHPATLTLYSTVPRVGGSWNVATEPEVEALHVAESGTRLLIQVHRARSQVVPAPFKDPALAIWEIGKPTPTRYDELFLNEQPTKGFVHLDVDAAAQGAPFLFDSGVVLPSGGGPSGGGGDVTQEWGVVRGSLWQKLAIPAIGRTAGFFGARWRSDLSLYNSGGDAVDVTLRFVPNGSTGTDGARNATLTLGAGETYTSADVLYREFGLDNAAGTLFVTPTPGQSVAAVARVANVTDHGSFTTSVPSFDVNASASPGFPVSFAAALGGWRFRTNIAGVNLAPFDQHVEVKASSSESYGDWIAGFLGLPSSGAVQINRVASWLGLFPWETGSLIVRPTTAGAIAGISVIDNVTNDPNFYGPDLLSPRNIQFVRTIPQIVHDTDADGLEWRSDLYLFNTSDAVASVGLSVLTWNTGEVIPGATLALLPGETQVVRDVLRTLFRRTGTAQLVVSGWSSTADGIRFTSRLYANHAGGTIGTPMPPLNSFMGAGPAETVEIIGLQGGAANRVNLSIVGIPFGSASGGQVPSAVEILDDRGHVMDTFEVRLGFGQGIEIRDLFRARGLGDGPPGAVIRVTPQQLLIAAFAKVVDRESKDPALFVGTLAAR